MSSSYGQSDPELPVPEEIEIQTQEDRHMAEVIRRTCRDILPTGYIAIQSGAPRAFRPTPEEWAILQECRLFLQSSRGDGPRLDAVCVQAGVGVSELPLMEWFLAGYPWANDKATALRVFGEYGKLCLSTFAALERRETKSDRAFLEQLRRRR